MKNIEMTDRRICISSTFNDMHAENILPCNDRPAVVDMESIISTKKKMSTQIEEDEEPLHLLCSDYTKFLK